LTVPLAVSLILTGASPSAAFARSTDAGIVQLVVGNATTLTAADLVLVNELTDMAYDVRLRDDGDPDTSSGSTAIVVAPSATAASLGTKYAASVVPEVILGNDDWGNLNLANTSGNSYGTTNLIIVDSSNPIADGLPSTFAPAIGYFPLHVVNGANMPPSADDVAVRSNADGSSSDALFTYRTGNTMANGATAAGARVALGYTEETLNNLSDDGQHLLDNAIYWADNENVAPQAVAGTAASNVVGRWPLAAIKPSANGTPGSTPNALNTAGEDGLFFANSTVCSNVSTNCPRRPSPYADKSMLYFPGWTDAVQQGGTYVLPSGTASAAYIPHNPMYEPGAAGNFSVSAYIRPTDSTMAPQIAAENDTLNIIQEGLAATGPGQETPQWKMSITKKMFPNCVFKGWGDVAPHTIVNTLEVPAATGVQPLTPGTKYLVTCSLNIQGNAQTAKLIVTQITTGGPIPLYHREALAYFPIFNVTNPMDVWIGKKPNKLYPGDAYSGYISNVVIKRS